MIRRGLIASTMLAAAMGQGAMAQTPATYDLLIRNGMIYDGSGGAPYAGDIAVKVVKMVYAGPAAEAKATTTVDAHGLAVAPGFINMLSWANESLLVDGMGQ